MPSLLSGGRRPRLAWADAGLPGLRAVRRGVRAAAGACQVLLGCLPHGLEPGAHSGPLPGDTALGWSAAAMGDAARRLGEARGLDLPQALAVISEAVWWVTMVDATVVRYYPGAYDRVLAALDPAARRAAEGRLGGLRFVRNWMGYHADPAELRPAAAGPGRRRPAGSGLDVGPGARPGSRPCPAGQGVGDEPVPAVPGIAGRAPGGPDRRGGRRVPVPGLEQQRNDHGR